MGLGGDVKLNENEEKEITNITKVAIFTKNEGSSTFPKHKNGWSFFKMYFRRRPPDRKPLAFEENPRTNLEIQGPLCDEGTFKNIENHANSRFDNLVRPDSARPGPRKLRTISPHTSVVSKPPQLP